MRGVAEVTGVNEYFDVEDAKPSHAADAGVDRQLGPHAAGGAAYGAVGRSGQRALWFGVAGVTAIVTIAAVGWPQIGWLAAQTTTTTWTARHAIEAVQVDVSGGDLIVEPSAGGDA